MTFAYTPYVLPLIFAAIVAGWIAVYTWRRRAIVGARPLALLALAICWWQVTYALEIAGIDLQTKIFWGRLQYPSIVSIPQLMLLFTLLYTHNTRLVNLRGHLLTAGIPFITTLLVLTSDFNTLVWRTVTMEWNGHIQTLQIIYGPWFWIHWAYSYLMLLAAALMIFRQLRTGQAVYRRQAGVMLAAMLAPWIGNAIYVSKLTPLPGLDFTPFGFTITVVCLAWSIFGFHLIDLHPIARDLVVDDLVDGMVVLDPQNRIADINPAAVRFFSKPAQILLGMPVLEALSERAPLFEHQINAVDALEEICLNDGPEPHWVELRISPMYDARRNLIGRVAVIRDITRRKQAENQVRQLSQAVESSPVSVVITDTAGAIQYVNPKFANTTGYSLDEIRGKNPRILKTEFTPPYVHRQLWETITAGREWRGEFCNRKKNGDIYWEQASISPILGDDGRPVSFVALKEDITEQRKLREQLRQQNTYLSFMHQMTLELLDRRQIEDLLAGIVEGASALLDAPFGAFFLAEDEGLVSRACTETMNTLAGQRLTRGTPDLIWQAYDSGMPGATNFNGSGAPPGPELMAQIKTAAAFPIMAGRRCRGVLALGRPNPNQPFDQNEVQTGMLFTRLAALVLDNAELYDAAIKEIAEHKLTQAQLQQSEARYRQIIENASDPIFLIGTDRRFTYANPTTLRVLGFDDSADLLGHPFGDIVAPELRTEVDEYYQRQACQREPAAYFEFPALRADGEMIWFGQNTQLIENRSEIVGYQCIARDITAARQAQEVLRIARDQAVEASHFKSQLLARVSHELRTPLGAVIGFIELLQAGIYGPMSAEQAQTIDKIRASSEYLTSMINDLLDSAQLESRRLTLRLDHCAPRALLEHIEERMAVLAAKKGLTLHTSIAPELPRRLVGDRQRLEQILTNLVGNAIKYTDQGEVCVHFFMSGNERWGIIVSDTGIGIPETELSHIFEPFYQVQLEDGQRRRGAGLGLAITHQLVDLMGGKLTVESRPGHGSAFTVTLPMERVVSNTAGLTIE